jgi:hypothetical protein
MPYIPPSKPSRAASNGSSPRSSRRSSWQHHPSWDIPASTKSELPQSASNLTHHGTASNRGPASVPILEFTIPSTASCKQVDANQVGITLLRQSPSPVIDDSKILSGAIISASDSTLNLSDNQETKAGPRCQQLKEFAEIRAAMRIMEQQRDSFLIPEEDDTSNPDKTPARRLDSIMLPKDLEEKPAPPRVKWSPPASTELGHSTQSTEHAAFNGILLADDSVTPSTTSENEISDEEFQSSRRKPTMLRKKSGEFVRPALREPSAWGHTSSVPCTLTFSKVVHFDINLEQIKHFCRADRPLAVSAGSSLVATYDSGADFPFTESQASPPFKWAIVLSNFPAETPLRLAQPVRVERVFLSSDTKTLIGSVAVANLAFHKYVVARFTLDYWKTVFEVVAEYYHDVRRPKHTDGYDRFNFSIKLADLANLEGKTMFFCVKYLVNGQEYWDNNNSTNLQIDFRKEEKPRNRKNDPSSTALKPISNSLVRSRTRSHPPCASPSPETIPAAVYDFWDSFNENYKLPYFKKVIHTYLDESATPLRMKGAGFVGGLPNRRAPVIGEAFGNRYDFGLDYLQQFACTTFLDGLPVKGALNI